MPLVCTWKITIFTVYISVVVLVAIAVAIMPFIKRSLDTHEYIYKALVLLVSACPCALVISTPVATACGLATAARLGLLIKGGGFLEALGKLRAVAFDKTGTLTEGQFQMVDIKFVDSEARNRENLLHWYVKISNIGVPETFCLDLFICIHR